jgi:hypothetical protein
MATTEIKHSMLGVSEFRMKCTVFGHPVVAEKTLPSARKILLQRPFVLRVSVARCTMPLLPASCLRTIS